MNRFKTSKYRNSVAKCPKKENSITDLSVETPMSFGNHVKSALKYTACNIGNAGSGKLAVFNTGDKGRKGNSNFLPAHGSSLTDFEFSPFYHDKLLTASDDCTVKLWNVPDNLDNLKDISPVEVMKNFERRPELICHNPIADSLISISSGSNIYLHNINNIDFRQELDVAGSDLIQSTAWSNDGKMLACTSKSKKLAILDPRSSDHVIGQLSAHDNHKDSRVIWLSSSSSKLLTTGFGRSRARELKGWDARNLKSCLYMKEMGTSTGVLMPFFDPDTNMLFVAGKGDSSLSIMECADGEDFLTEASSALLTDQTKGMCLAPKLSLDVMQCEVDRLYQLCKTQLVPVMIQVPRRFYREFQPELFPYTASDEVVLSTDDWLGGKDALRATTSMDPSKRTTAISKKKVEEAPAPKPSKEAAAVVKPPVAATKPALKPTPTPKPQQPAEVSPAPVKEEQQRRSFKKFQVGKTSKFRHWLGKVLHPSTHLTNIQRLSTTLLGSGNGFDVNEKRAAIPLSVAGGHVAILELSKTGRQAGSLTTVENQASVIDFSWNPFNNQQLAVALDTGVIKIWQIPTNGLTNSITKEQFALEGHYARVSCLAWHPLASDLLATAGFDSRIIVWDVSTGEQKITIDDDGQQGEFVDMAWSRDGKSVACINREGKVVKYNVRTKPTKPINVGSTPGGCKNARLAWVLDDKFIVTSYINKNGARCLAMLHTNGGDNDDIEATEIDNAVALLMPHYDEDSNVLFLAGKGDHSLLSFELSTSEPYVTYLTSYRADQAYQAFCFQHKTTCDVRKVEFARAWKLSKTTIEPMSFTIPRVKMEYFQDDLFPKTKKNGQATMTAVQWLDGSNKQMEKISLRPTDMKALSEAPKEVTKERKYDSYNANTYKTDEERREELVAAMSSKLNLDKKLEQDDMEGVDEDEWSD